MSDEMGRSIAVEDRHLAVHEDDIWFGVSGAGSFQQIVESFFAIPYRIHREPDLFDCLESNLLVNSTAIAESVTCSADTKEHTRDGDVTDLSSTTRT